MHVQWDIVKALHICKRFEKCVWSTRLSASGRAGYYPELAKVGLM